MVGLTWSSTLIVATLAAPPTLPPDGAEPNGAEPKVETVVPAEPVPAPEPAPVLTPTPEPTPEPKPEPMPVVSTPAPAVAQAYDDELPERYEHDDEDDDDEPVERFQPGQWGMQFTFGGLAPMTIGGLRDFGVNRLLFTELGFRRVLGESWVMPFSVGAGVFHHNPDSGDSQNDVGLAASFGLQRYFRVWRRIAPYAGGRMRFGYSEPNGRANWMVGFGLGPVIGIEYFVRDRVSLSLQGDAQVGITQYSGLLQVELATRVDAGGQMGLVFYF